VNIKNYYKYVLIGILFGIMPVLQSLGLISSSSIIVLGTVMFYGIVGLGMNVLLGYSGLISLGTAGFMGLGAYLSAYLTQDLNLPFIVSVLISVAIPLVIGIVIGLISLRIEGYYLAIATLGVAEILRQVFVEFDGLTGGFSGKNSTYPTLFGYQLDRAQSYWLICLFLVGSLILVHNMIHSRTGRALLTMRGSEAAAKAMGINLLKYRLVAFGIATFFAALGGVLYVHFIRFSYPSAWSITLSLQILAVIVIGGMRTIIGPLVGAFIVFGVPELLLKQLPIIGNIDGLAYIFTGLLIIGVIMFYPNGLIYLADDIKRKLKVKHE
jgi:branched-chain amino acid transport system permease protein